MDKTLGQIAHEAACKAGWVAMQWSMSPDGRKAGWEAIAAAVAAAVKEEDARICEDLPIMIGKRLTTPDDCAAAIRASIEEVKS